MTQPNFKQILPFVVHTTPSSLPLEVEPLAFKTSAPADNDINFDKVKPQAPISPSITTAVLVTIGLALTGWIFTGSSEKKADNKLISLVSLPVIPTSVLNANERILLSPADKTIPASSTPKTDILVPSSLEEPVKLQISSVVPPVILTDIDPKKREQAQAFIIRAEKILKDTKDIGAARLFLERALALGDQKASLLLGETYDPAILKRQGAKGISGDTKRAREFYEQAAASGIENANKRLSDLH